MSGAVSSVDAEDSVSHRGIRNPRFECTSNSDFTEMGRAWQAKPFQRTSALGFQLQRSLVVDSELLKLRIKHVDDISLAGILFCEVLVILFCWVKDV